MRTKGAETRNLVPFAVELAQEMATKKPSTHANTVLGCASSLLDFYMLLSMDEYNSEAAANATRRCALLYKALNSEAEGAGDYKCWALKPKLHLFQELGEFMTKVSGNPRDFLTYKDEDFVGWVATMARKRGGPKSAASTANAAIDKYRALCRTAKH